MVFSLSALICRRIRGLWKLPDGRNWLRGTLGLVLMGGAMLSKYLIQFCWWVVLCSLPAIYLGPNCGGGNEDNGDLLQKIPCVYCYTHCPQPFSRPPLTHASAGDSWTLPGKSGSVSYGFNAPFSWILVHRGSVCALQGSISHSCVSSGSSLVGLMATSSKRIYAIPKSAAPRAPVPVADPYLHRIRSNTDLSQSMWGPWRGAGGWRDC